jgi:protease secretion system outer membrane protein
LIDRLAAAYLQVLLSEEGQRLAAAQVEALIVQTRQADKRFKSGEGTRVDVAQTQAALDVAKVRSLEAADALDLARRQLRRITGLPSQALKRAPTDLTPDVKPLESLVDWLQLALRQSPTLQAREQALVAARMNVSRNFAGHLPRVDLVASVSRSQSETLNTLNQTSTLKSLGVQLNVPIYSGGGVDAGVKQAMADQARVEEEIRSERENIEVEVQRHFMAVSNGGTKIAAYRQAVESSELALLGTRRVLDQGLGTNNDVADAQARLYGAQRDLAQARIEYLQSRLRLMLQAGMPMTEVVAELDRSLTAASSAPR